MAKTVFDCIFAGIGLLVSLPLMLLLAILIKLDSPGPIFFKHLRVGLHGREFWMYKFRKMRDDLRPGPKLSPKHDPRLTRIGRIMERFKLDELPQFWNILRGEMSVVGPRPEIPEIVRLYTPEQRRILTVKPGLVGPNQIACRNEKELIPENVSDIESYYVQHLLQNKLQRDLQYVRERTFWRDMKYLVAAIGATLLEPLSPAHWQRRGNELRQLAIDLGLATAGFLTALVLKLDSLPGVEEAQTLLPAAAILLFWLGVAFVFLGIDRQVWQFFSKPDLLTLLKAILFAHAAGAMSIYVISGWQFPISLFLLDIITTTGYLCAFRLALACKNEKPPGKHRHGRTPALVYGADSEGELLLRRLEANPGMRAMPIGIIDHDSRKRGQRIHDLQVLGNAHDLPALHSIFGVKEIYIPEREANGDLEQLLRYCRELGISCRFVSTLFLDEPVRMVPPSAGKRAAAYS